VVGLKCYCKTFLNQKRRSGIIAGIIEGRYALVPSFICILKAPVKLAIGTSLATFFWMDLLGSIFKIYQGVVNLSVAISLGIGAAIGAVLGAKLMAKIKPRVLKALFGLLFLYVSLKYILLYFDIHI